MQRSHFKQTAPLELRLEEQAKRLRQEAEGTPSGAEHEKLIRRARQAETASHIISGSAQRGSCPRPDSPQMRKIATFKHTSWGWLANGRHLSLSKPSPETALAEEYEAKAAKK